MTIEIIASLFLCGIGLVFWLTRRYKYEGGVEVQTKILQENLNAKTNEADRLSQPARDRATVMASLRKKSKT